MSYLLACYTQSSIGRNIGYLHGAYTEGQDIAMTLADCIKDGECDQLGHLERVRNPLPYDVE